MRAKIAGTLATVLRSIWSIANSAIVIAIVSGVFLAAISRSYSEREEAAKDLATRGEKLEAALTELQQRLSYLQAADRIMEEDRCAYPKASDAEWEAITGTGAYVPTAPSWRGIHLSVVLSEAQRASGAWDPGYEGGRLLGVFSTKPPMTAIWVQGQLPWLQKYLSNRMWAISLGHLPLAKGQEMTKDLERKLGIPTLEEVHKESDRLAAKVASELAGPGPAVAPCATGK